MKLNVAICQVDMEWEETEHNLARIEKVVAEAAADVVVLPEMFATGFKLRPSVVAETMDGPVVTAMRRWAREYGKAVVGSVVILEDGIYRNRMLFVEPSGKMTQYDKYHLFRPGGAGRDYTPGKRGVVVEYKGFRFLMQVCYDLRFPVFSRNRGDYDAIIYCASWDNKRRDAWCALLRARAIENQSYVIGVNRVGTDPDAVYIGDSKAIDYLGRTMADAESGEWTMVVTLDLEEQRAFRQSFPAWMDADDFELKNLE